MDHLAGDRVYRMVQEELFGVCPHWGSCPRRRGVPRSTAAHRSAVELARSAGVRPVGVERLEVGACDHLVEPVRKNWQNF